MIPTTAYLALLIIGALFGVPYLAYKFWRGTNALTGEHWWPARAKKFRERTTEESSDSTLCKMIELRWKADGRKQRHPSQVPGRALWPTPEYVVLVIVRCAAFLRTDGLSDPAATEKIDTTLGLGIITDDTDRPTVMQYLVRLLETRFPGYVRRYPKELEKAIGLAQRHADFTFSSEGRGYPPSSWLKERISHPDFDREFAERVGAAPPLIPDSRFDEELTEFLVRRQDHDELWRFSSSSESWRALGGRGGIALVRDGRVLAHITTMMN